ncbi:MAG: hypothetical protein SGARI_001586 [Bacillariaceae sp.]
MLNARNKGKTPPPLVRAASDMSSLSSITTARSQGNNAAFVPKAMVSNLDGSKSIADDKVKPIEVGTVIQKNFHGKPFFGQVLGTADLTDKQGNAVLEKHYKVLYDDEDTEDVPASEIQALMTNSQSPFQGMFIQKPTKIGGRNSMKVGKIKKGPLFEVSYSEGPVKTEYWTCREIQKSAITMGEYEKGDANNNPDANEAQKQSPAKKRRKNDTTETDEEKKMKKDLEYCMGLRRDEIERAFEALPPPRNLNKLHEYIFAAKNGEDTEYLTKDSKFVAEIGAELRANKSGHVYYGRITHGPYRGKHESGKTTQLWDVAFDYDTEGDCPESGYDFEELLGMRADRPMLPPRVFGTPFKFAEVFSGQGIMTQKFQDKKWMVRSIDWSPSSAAIHKVDVMALDFDKHIGAVPDCIVLAPDCSTYSLLAGKPDTHDMMLHLFLKYIS